MAEQMFVSGCRSEKMDVVPVFAGLGLKLILWQQELYWMGIATDCVKAEILQFPAPLREPVAWNPTVHFHIINSQAAQKKGSV